MFDDSENAWDFQTETQVSFGPKKITPEFQVRPFFVDQEPRNCVLDQYKIPLGTKKRNKMLPPQLRLETVEEFLEKEKLAQKSSPCHSNFIETDFSSINDEFLDEELSKFYLTTYSKEFSSKNKVHQNLDEGTNEIDIFKDWFFTETTQNQYFRHPRRIDNDPSKKLEDNLKPDENERKILKIKTGVSEYQRLIGEAGKKILECTDNTNIYC